MIQAKSMSAYQNASDSLPKKTTATEKSNMNTHDIDENEMLPNEELTTPAQDEKIDENIKEFEQETRNRIKEEVDNRIHEEV